MAFTLLSIFSLFFPFALFTGGAYIAYRGIVWNKGSLSGAVSSKTSFESPLSKQKCVYYKVTVEYYSGGPEAWKRIMALESPLREDGKRKFMIAGKEVDASRAVFEISNPLAYKGYMSSKFRGMVGAFMEYAQKTAPVEMTLDVMNAAGLRDQDDFVSRNEYLPDEMVSSLLSSPTGKILRAHSNKPFRIYEYVIPEGATLYTSGFDESSSTPGDIVISDKGLDAADSSVRERGFVRMAIGAGLIILSLMISVLILLS